MANNSDVVAVMESRDTVSNTEILDAKQIAEGAQDKEKQPRQKKQKQRRVGSEEDRPKKSALGLVYNIYCICATVVCLVVLVHPSIIPFTTCPTVCTFCLPTLHQSF